MTHFNYCRPLVAALKALTRGDVIVSVNNAVHREAPVVILAAKTPRLLHSHVGHFRSAASGRIIGNPFRI